MVDSSFNVSEEMGNEMQDRGTFIGHFMPGLAATAFASLWTYNNLFQYHAARKENILNGKEMKMLNFRSTIFPKFSKSSPSVPVQPYLIIITATTGYVLETIGILQGRPIIKAIEHILMYSFFWLFALCPIFRRYKYELPPSAAHAVFMVTNMAAGYIFSQHQRGGLTRKMHMTLSLLAYLTALCTACEIANRKSILVTLGKTLSFMALGFWFILIGFILYPYSFMPKWEASDHIKMEIITPVAIVNVVVACFVVFAINVIVSVRVKSLNMATLNRLVTFSETHKYSAVNTCDGGKQLLSDSDDDH
ncbi:Protein of unknown function DUF716 (TMEM45) [Trinorchestia longiramus]|nr:Protein of unknown function DUF716 (TMEM45) [Trinorchestia longiramus]